MSPLSLKACLSMVASGATKGSATEKEMVAVLGDITPVPVDPAIDVANSAWVRGPIKADYLEHIRKAYLAEAATLPSVDPTPINDWVKKSTRGRIETLFDESLNPNTVMVLVNTVFFKGSWANSFDAQDTREAAFKAFEGSAPCQLMYQKDKRTMYTEFDLAQAVRLPYASGGLSATVLLPKKEGPEALAEVVSSLTPESWAKLHTRLEADREHVELEMPRFKVDFGLDNLNSLLAEMGMPSPFKEEEGGGFLRMSDDPCVHIDVVAHKATIEVNEEGTVAAAATGAVMKTRCMPPPSVPMTVDRPFLFLITDKDGAVVFVATVLTRSAVTP